MSSTWCVFGLEKEDEAWVRECLEENGLALPMHPIYGRNPSINEIVTVLETLEGYDCTWSVYKLDKDKMGWEASIRPENYILDGDNSTTIDINDYKADNQPYIYCLRNINALDVQIMQRLSKVVGTLVAYGEGGGMLAVSPDTELTPLEILQASF